MTSLRPFALCLLVLGLTACPKVPGMSTLGGGDDAQAGAPAGAAGDAGLPPVITDLIAARYPGQPDAQRINAAVFTRSSAAFEAAWQAYQARLASVTPEVEAARRQADAGELAAAVARLRALITPLPRAAGALERGAIIAARASVTPADAEVPAIVALVDVAARAKEYAVLVELAPELYGRRRVGADREAERLIWFGYRNGKSLYDLGVGAVPESAEKIRAILEQAAKAVEGPALAAGLVASLPDRGLARGFDSYDNTSVAPGTWVLDTVMLDGTKFDDRGLHYHYKKTVAIPHSCAPGSKIIGVDPVTGDYRFEVVCQYTQRPVELWIDAALLADPPAWRDEEVAVTVVGRVTRQGPRWELADARIVDLRGLDLRNAKGWSLDAYEEISDAGQVEVIRP